MTYSTKESQQKAILVHIEFYNFEKTNSSLNAATEFRELSVSSGARIVGDITGKLDRPNASLFLKKGKAEEVRDLANSKWSSTIAISYFFITLLA